MRVLLLVMPLLIAGCSPLHTTNIEGPLGSHKIVSRAALVEVHKGDAKIIVDNRGTPGSFSKLIDYLMLRAATKSED